MLPSVLYRDGQRYVYAGAVNWSQLTSSVAGLGLTYRFEHHTSQAPYGKPQWERLTLFAQKIPAAEFSFYQVGDDVTTHTPIWTLTSDVAPRLRGGGLGILGYLLVLQRITQHHRGWAAPAVVVGETTSPAALRVWQSLAVSGELQARAAVFRSRDGSTGKITAWSWRGTVDPAALFKV
jgi:hypothetical protein